MEYIAQLILKQREDGKIEMELHGTDVQVSKMVAVSMSQDKDLPGIILGAIPTALDLMKVPRKGVCELIMNGVGMKEG